MKEKVILSKKVGLMRCNFYWRIIRGETGKRQSSRIALACRPSDRLVPIALNAWINLEHIGGIVVVESDAVIHRHPMNRS